MKPLRILIGNNTLSLLAGSETWTLTMAVALQKLGHTVRCYSPDLGLIASKLTDAGIPCFDKIAAAGPQPFTFVLEEKVEHEYDVIIASHLYVVEYLRSQFPKTPIISTIHGVLHLDTQGNKMPEHPALESGVAQFVAVSEEVRDKLKNDYGIDSTIIRNAFDVKTYADIEPPAQGTPKQFLINTNYSEKDDPLVAAVREAAKHYGARCAAVGQNFMQAADLTRIIKDSDVVFGMGRSVLEGVAAGRLGIVHGRWGTGGPVIESNIEALRFYNFSGRNAASDEPASAEEIIKMVDQYYQPQFLEWGKGYIARDHNAVFAAEKYVALARELTGEMIVRPVAAQAVDPEARSFRLAQPHGLPS